MNVDDYIEIELLGGAKELTLWNIYLEHSLNPNCKFTLCALFGCALPSKVRLVEHATDSAGTEFSELPLLHSPQLASQTVRTRSFTL